MKTLLIVLALFIELVGFAQTSSLKFNDHTLPIDQRVDDLIGQLTLEEKVAQMLNATPAIPRLGILAYDWWNEVLHGVARTPFKVTVFPQAIGMAATFDTASLFTMADYSALEGRAIHNKAIELGRTGDRYLGLTYWTPNINIFRDPRWGRGQETYGEDPFLTAMLARAFVTGLQGNDPKYLKAAACAKHFAVHSGPEPLRHAFNADVSNYDLWDTYLPAFKELVVNAKVAGVMCAYNAFRKEPCCASDLLMNDILRNQWKFTGYVTSDCGAIDDFFNYHKTHPDAQSASVDAVLHGTDVDCGNVAYKALFKAVKEGKIKEEQLDVSLRRLFTIRFRLGMFDPPSIVKYAQTPSSILESEPHQQHALKMARQSIVLLKNENGSLPLRKGIKKIVVLGPNADNPIAVLGNYNGTPSEIVTAVEGIRNKLGNEVEIIYEKAINFTDDTLLVYADLSEHFTAANNKGVKVEYFANNDLAGTPALTKFERQINQQWNANESFAAGYGPAFSARYTTTFTAMANGPVIFEVDADDGYRFFIEGKELINAWTRNRWGARTHKLVAEKGKEYKVTLEYRQQEGKGYIRLRTGNYARTDYPALMNRIKGADAIVYVGGISPQLEGEEMRVDYPGFNGGDRTTILLPAIQTELMKKLKASGIPVVFVMMTGSAIAIPWENENIPAIMNAWYGGQSAGTAIADVLFGDYNPAGRLPVTFYRSDADLPDFNSYDMRNRTYRYFNGRVLYPFGYGLSYTNFHYDNLSLPASITKGEDLILSVKVKNTGKMAGEEVVQLYVSHAPGKTAMPVRALKGFQRIWLAAGEERDIHFRLTPEDLSLVNEAGTSYQPGGPVTVSTGGGQPGQNIQATSNVVSKQVIIN